MPKNQIIIQRSLIKRILIIIAIAMFIIPTAYFYEEVGSFEKFIFIAGILFLGIGGLIAIFCWRKPILIISEHGITAPLLRSEYFIEWSNIKNFMVEETFIGTSLIGVYFLGILVSKEEKIRDSSGKAVKLNTSTSLWSGGRFSWSGALVLAISLQYSIMKPEKIVEILKEFQTNYYKARKTARQ